MDGKKFIVLAAIYLFIALFISASVISNSVHSYDKTLKFESQSTLSVFPVYYNLINRTFTDPIDEVNLPSGMAGFFVDDNNQLFYIGIYPSLIGTNITYIVNFKSYGAMGQDSIDISPQSKLGQNFVAEFLYYKETVEWPNMIVISAVSYINGETGDPYARITFFKQGYASIGDNVFQFVNTMVSNDMNLSIMSGRVAHFSSPSDLYTRVYVVPYTQAPIIGTFYNTPEKFTYAFAVVKDVDGIWTTIYRVYFNGSVAGPVMTYSYTIEVPLAFLYSIDRSKLYVFAAHIVESQHNVMNVEMIEFDANTGEFLSSNLIGSVTLPSNMYYPDLFIYYLQPYVTFTQDESGNLVTSEPIKFVLYSPTAQKAYYVSISLNVTMGTSLSATVTSATVERSIDLSTITGGDIQKARVTHPDFISSRAQLYGPIFVRQAVYDSDLFYNPYSYKVFIYTTSGWESFSLEDVIPKIDYLKPKVNVQNNYVALYGYVSPLILDTQYMSNDGVKTSGIVIVMARFIPYKKYDVTPTKFTYRIQYNYYVTPITITYTKSDPDEPDTLTNVLVPINITDSTILNTIVTADARDVRFFQENTYGGDYWKYSGLTYAVKERTTDYILFYVLIPSITADSPITIYMYSGFQYASPVAADYYSLISTYPILIAQTS